MHKIVFFSQSIPVQLNSGKKLYTYHLLKSLSKYAEVTLIGYADPQIMSTDIKLNIRVIPVKHPCKNKIGSLLSIYPNIIYQTISKELKKEIKKNAQKGDFDAIICNHLEMCWAAAMFNSERQRVGKRRINTVFVAHNFETAARYSIFKNEQNIAKVIAFLIDVIKIKFQEKKALKSFDAVTAITDEDAREFRKISSRRVEVLRPGYEGSIHRRIISERTKRQVVILGSCFWEAKKNNLKQFIKAADEKFYLHGITLKVVGSGPSRFMERVGQDAKTVEFTGWVNSFKEDLLGSRIGVLAEASGGGFKLKILDYVFHSLPIFATKGSIAGIPLVAGADFIEAYDNDSLVELIIANIDNFSLLNNLNRRAIQKCENEVDWDSRGHLLFRVATHSA